MHVVGKVQPLALGIVMARGRCQMQGVAIGGIDVAVDVDEFNQGGMFDVLDRPRRRDNIASAILTRAGQPGTVHDNFASVDRNPSDRQASQGGAESPIQPHDRQNDNCRDCR